MEEMIIQMFIDEGFSEEEIKECLNKDEYSVYNSIQEFITNYVAGCMARSDMWITAYLDYDAMWNDLVRDLPLVELPNGKVCEAYGLSY